MKRKVLTLTIHSLRNFIGYAGCASILLVLAACSSIAQVNAPKTQQTVVVNPSFQVKVSPVPTIPTYRCGAWSSNNSPGAYSSITIYARLTTTGVNGVAGASAKAIVHFKDNDQQLDQQPTSDDGGYVSFPLQLQGQQPRLLPATVDVIFTLNGQDITCTQAFFTPQ